MTSKASSWYVSEFEEILCCFYAVSMGVALQTSHEDITQSFQCFIVISYPTTLPLLKQGSEVSVVRAVCLLQRVGFCFYGSSNV